MRKLLNIHNKYQTDGACIVEHGINFPMSSDGNCPSDIFSGIRGSRVSAAHNVHEAHGRYQQGGTMSVAFTRLASYVTDTGVDHTGLGRWSWIQVGTGEHRTRIVSATNQGRQCPPWLGQRAFKETCRGEAQLQHNINGTFEKRVTSTTPGRYSGGSY